MKANGQEINRIKLNPTNCYLIKCQDGYLQIDTDYAKHYDTFVRELGKRNIEASEIKYLLLTHHHDDHAGFAAKLKEQAGCKIIAHKNAVAPLKNGETRVPGKALNKRVAVSVSLYKRLFPTNYEYPPVLLDKNDIIVSGDDDDTLRWLGVKGKIIHTPGHSNDSISVIMDDGGAFVGDVAMNPLRFVYCGLKYKPIFLEDLNLVFDSWQKIIDNGVTMIYPSHGRPFAIDKLAYYRKKVYGQ